MFEILNDAELDAVCGGILNAGAGGNGGNGGTASNGAYISQSDGKNVFVGKGDFSVNDSTANANGGNGGHGGNVVIRVHLSL